MKTIRTLMLIAALGSTVAACGSRGGTTSQPASAASPTAFVLQEWSITAPTTQIHAGNVLVTATNRGSETHELVIVRAGLWYVDCHRGSAAASLRRLHGKWPEVAELPEFRNLRSRRGLPRHQRSHLLRPHRDTFWRNVDGY